MCLGKADKACQAYGGCEYLDICSGRATLEEYKSRFAENTKEDKKKGQEDILDSLLNEKPEGNKKMSGFLKKATQVGQAAEKTTSKPKPKPAPEPKVETKAEKQKAPWYYDGCVACKRANLPVLGLNKKNEPCKVCLINAEDENEHGGGEKIPMPDEFTFEVKDDGTAVFARIGDETPALETNPIEQEPTTTEQVESQGGTEFEEELLEEDPQPESKPEPKEKQETTKATEKEVPSIEYTQQRSGNKGLVISYHSIRSRKARSAKLGGEACVILAAELLKAVEPKLLSIAKNSGCRVDHWQEIDAFKRRDLIKLNAEAIAQEVGNSWIDAAGIIRASDEHCLCAALEPFSSALIGEIH